MADFTSTQNGNWDDGATWGNTSPGVAGTDYPGANGDTATIGHTVTYDSGDSSVEYSGVTINSSGILTFPTSADSTLKFGASGVLTINSGGELRAGTSTTPIDSSYHCYIHWLQGSSSRYVLVLNNGGIITIYGDPDYYGSERYADLDSDWTSGQTLYVTGDYSSTWQSGQKFWIHENGSYSNYLTDGHVYTIDTVGSYDSANDRTPITISEAAPGLTFDAVNNGYQSRLIMVSRNVELADPGASWSVGGFDSYSEYIRLDNNQAAPNNNININDAVFRGWYSGGMAGEGFVGKNLVFINNYRAIEHTDLINLDADFISNYAALYDTTHSKITGVIASCFAAFYYSRNVKFVGDSVGNRYAATYNDTNNIILIGNIVSSYRGSNNGFSNTFIGNFINNNIAINAPFGDVLVKNGRFVGNATDFSYANNDEKTAIVLENCVVDGNQRDFRAYQNCGTILPLVSGDTGWQTPDSGNDWILQMTPNSYCADNYMMQMELAPINSMYDHVSSGSNTLTFKIYPSGWTTTLDQDDIVLEIYYPDSASGVSLSKIVNTTNTYSNGAWRDLSVTFTPGQDGLIHINLYLRRYEASSYVLIDPVWSIA
ncbi:MAG: hypothetical protein DRP56_04770 [Planctomycetota bacterium]|nr:MAG: hypothetical protein DRP56_04770 [Planctomycetota bacterium]